MEQRLVTETLFCSWDKGVPLCKSAGSPHNEWHDILRFSCLVAWLTHCLTIVNLFRHGLLFLKGSIFSTPKHFLPCFSQASCKCSSNELFLITAFEIFFFHFARHLLVPWRAYLRAIKYNIGYCVQCIYCQFGSWLILCCLPLSSASTISLCIGNSHGAVCKKDSL